MARKLLAEVRGEVVAVLGQQIVGGALELFARFVDDGFDLVRRGDRETVQDLAAKGAAGWLCLGFCPVHARHPWLVMPAVCIFLAVDDDA